MKWEYQFVILDMGQYGWQPRYINGQELPGWTSKPPVHIFSNELGSQGWDLVSFVPITITTSDLQFWSGSQKVSTNLSIQMVFKRALENTTE